MALFRNKADDDLPILTRFYQLDVPERGAGESETEYEGRLFASELGVWISSYQPESRPSGLLPSRIDDRAMLADLQRTIRGLMGALADGQVPTEYLQDDLTEFRLRYLAPKEIVFSPTLEGGVVVERCIDDWADVYIIPILRAFEEAAIQGSFSRCAECESAFVLTRKGQKYCSQRCSHRAGERRRYVERFAEYKHFRGK